LWRLTTIVIAFTVADEGGRILPEYATAEKVAKEISARLPEEWPELKHRSFAILVTDQDDERIFRAPIDLANQRFDRIAQHNPLRSYCA
jgi:uncharacterized protein DUF6894